MICNIFDRFFKLILPYNKILENKEANEILEKHNKQEHPAVVKDFINLEAIAIAKIAHRKGIMVEVENPYLPKDMIPINELEKYKSYDFLNNIL